MFQRLISFMIGMIAAHLYASSEISEKNISFPTMMFQKTPKEAGYILIQEISNVISFSIQKKSLKTDLAFDLCVVKTLPTTLITKKDTSTLNLPLYIPLISPIYKNEWAVFTGFDKLTKNIESLSIENVPPVLKFLIYEMTLYTPKSISQDYTDLSQTYKNKFYSILNGFLGATKGKTNLYEHAITPTDADKAIIIKERFFFENLPSVPDLCVDVYRSLAQLLPFWMCEQDLQTLMSTENISQNQITPLLAASFYLKFSHQSKPLPDQVGDDFVALTLSLKKILTSTDLSNAYYQYMKDQYDQESLSTSGQKRSQSDYVTLSNLFINDTLYNELRIFFQQKRNSTHMRDFSYKNIILFIENYNKRMTAALERTKGYDSLKAILDQGIITDEEQKQNLIRLLANATQTKEQSLDLYKNPVDFSFFQSMISSDSLEALFNEQVLNDEKRVSSTPMPCLKMRYIFEFLPIFYTLHLALTQVGKNFQAYFDAMHPDHAGQVEAENATQMLQETIKDYHDFKNILKMIRIVYPGMGYLPKIHEKVQHPLLPQDRTEDTSAIAMPAAKVAVPTQEASPTDDKKTEQKEDAPQSRLQRRTVPSAPPANTPPMTRRTTGVKQDASLR
ncbi:MAG: hypothetical protein CNLJKLNK_01028 [Holosporales bacterium]